MYFSPKIDKFMFELTFSNNELNFLGLRSIQVQIRMLTSP